MKNTINIKIILCIFALLLISVIFISKERLILLTKDEKTFVSNSPKIASKWLKYCSSGELKKSIPSAKLLVDDSFQILPEIDYLNITRNSGINTMLITSEFNLFDAQRWAAAILSAKIAKKLIDTSETNFPENLLKFTSETYEITTDKDTITNEGSLWKILHNKKASPNAILRLASEISLQAGYNPIVITFHDEKQQEIATFLELRKDKNFFTISFEKKTVYKTNSQVLLNNIKNAKFARHHLPVEPSDYKYANYLLYQRLKALLPEEEIPTFGLKPIERISLAVKIGQQKNIPPTLFAYWSYPFFALKSDKDYICFNLESLNN